MSFYLPPNALNVSNGGTGLRTVGTIGQVLGVTPQGELGYISIPGSAGGTVTSVSLAAPPLFTVTNTPVLVSGTLTLAYTPGQSLPITSGGTGLLSVGAPGQVLKTNGLGTAMEWATPATPGTGTVTSVGVIPPSFLTASPAITSNGNITLAYNTGVALPFSSGGTGLTVGGGVGTFLQGTGTNSAPAWQVLNDTTTTSGAYFGGGENKGLVLVSGTQIGKFDATTEFIRLLATTSSVLEIGSTADFDNRLFISFSTTDTFYRIGNNTATNKTIRFENEITLPTLKPLATAYGGTGLITVGGAFQILRTNATSTGLEWTTIPSAVTSVGIIPPSFLTATAPVTSNGNITLAYNTGVPLPVSNGGTGLTVGGAIGTFLQGTGTGSDPAWQVLNDTVTTSGAYIGGGSNKGLVLVPGTQIGKFDGDTEFIRLLATVSSVLEIGSTLDFNNRLFISSSTADTFYRIGNNAALANKKIQFENEITLPATKPLLPEYGGTGITTDGAAGQVLTTVTPGNLQWLAVPGVTSNFTDITVDSGATFAGGLFKTFTNLEGIQIGRFNGDITLVRQMAPVESVIEIGTTTDPGDVMGIRVSNANAFYAIGSPLTLLTKTIKFENEITLPATKPLAPAYGGTGITVNGVAGQVLTTTSPGVLEWAAVPTVTSNFTDITVDSGAAFTGGADTTFPNTEGVKIGKFGALLTQIKIVNQVAATLMRETNTGKSFRTAIGSLIGATNLTLSVTDDSFNFFPIYTISPIHIVRNGNKASRDVNNIDHALELRNAENDGSAVLAGYDGTNDVGYITCGNPSTAKTLQLQSAGGLVVIPTGGLQVGGGLTTDGLSVNLAVGNFSNLARRTANEASDQHNLKLRSSIGDFGLQMGADSLNNCGYIQSTGPGNTNPFYVNYRNDGLTFCANVRSKSLGLSGRWDSWTALTNPGADPNNGTWQMDYYVFGSLCFIRMSGFMEPNTGFLGPINFLRMRLPFNALNEQQSCGGLSMQYNFTNYTNPIEARIEFNEPGVLRFQSGGGAQFGQQVEIAASIGIIPSPTRTCNGVSFTYKIDPNIDTTTITGPTNPQTH
jgi:hypothetical protein